MSESLGVFRCDSESKGGINIKLHDFLNLLYAYIGNNKPQDQFICELVDKYIDAKTEADNPLRQLSADTLKRYFTGRYKISVTNTRKILSKQNPALLADYIADNSNPNTIDIFISELQKLSLYQENGEIEVTEALASIFTDILVSISTKVAKKVEQTKVLTKDTLIPTVRIENGKLILSNDTFALPEKDGIPLEIVEKEQVYCKQLFMVYSEIEANLGEQSFNQENLPDKYIKHFQEQRFNFYNADYILRTISTIFQNGDDEASQLKNEINSSISDLLLDRYENGLRKLTAIMTHVTSVQLNKPAVASIPNFIGISEKKGICHTLVNDGMFTWVDYE